MARLRIYVDTSVVGGCFAREFARWSEALAGDFRAKRLVPVPSDVTAAEVMGAPPAVQALHDELVRLAGGVLPVTREVIDLEQAYDGRKILPRRHAAHAPHCDRDACVSRCRGELPFQAHRPTRQDSPVQCGQRGIGLSGLDDPVAP